MVQTHSRPQTLLDRFEELDAIWPDTYEPDRIATTSPGEDHIVIEDNRAPDFLHRHRWGLIAAAVTVAATSWLLLVAAPAQDHRLATQVLNRYDGALASIDLTVPDARSALAVLTNPLTEVSDLSDSLEQLSPFVTATNTARSAVSDALPDTLPLVPRTEIEAVATVRSDVGEVAGQAEGLATRLNSLVTYRLLTYGLFDLPELPTEAAPDTIDSLSVELAGAMAASVEVAVSLPSDPLLEAHRLATNETLAQMEIWRTEYLTALRAEDSAAAEVIVAEIEATLLTLHRTLAGSLAEIEAWGARELDLLRLSTIEVRQLIG